MADDSIKIKVRSKIHDFVLEELDEQDRIAHKLPRTSSYTDHLTVATDAIIQAIRENDAQ